MSNGYFLLEKSKVLIDIVLSSFKFRHFIRLKSVSNTRTRDFWIGYQIGFLHYFFHSRFFLSLAVFESVIESADRFLDSTFLAESRFIQKPNNLFLKFLKVFRHINDSVDSERSMN